MQDKESPLMRQLKEIIENEFFACQAVGMTKDEMLYVAMLGYLDNESCKVDVQNN